MKKLVACSSCLLVGVLFLMNGSMATATELIYTPTNPSFGGSPLNWSGLLQSATIQNKLKEELAVRVPKAPLERFTEQLEYSVFSQIAGRIVKTAFGEETLQPGEYTVGNYRFSVTTDANGITTTITEISTGNTTTIQIPYY